MNALINDFRNAAESPSSTNYEVLVETLKRSKAYWGSNPSEYEDIHAYIDRLSFFNPPSDLNSWVRTWNEIFPLMVDAGPLDTANVNGTKEWHLLLLPSLGMRNIWCSFLSNSETEKTEGLHEGVRLAQLWLASISKLKPPTTFLLTMLANLIISDGLIDCDSYYKPSSIFFGRGAGDDTSAWLLTRYMPEHSSMVNHICLLELEHTERIKMLLDYITSTSRKSIVIPQDYSTE